MTWIITRELNLFCNPEEIGDFFWANLFALESFKVIHCSVINVLCFAFLRQLDYFIKSLFVCQALFYFFELCFKFSVLRQLVYSIKMFFICQELFCFLLHICFKAKESAGGGIRTHAPLRTNGFQDRLVMTTSIPLHIMIHRRFERRTPWLKVKCSACWANGSFFIWGHSSEHQRLAH